MDNSYNKRSSAHSAHSSRARTAALRLICAALAVIIAAALCSCGSSTESKDSPATQAVGETIRTVGTEAQADLLIGKWVSYLDGLRFTAEYTADGSLTYIDANEDVYEYTYTVEGDRVTLTKDNKRQDYLWTADALTFILDHRSGEAEQLIYEGSSVIEDMSGYIYVNGDFLYIGKMCMCRESALDGAEDQTLAGTWIGAEGDKVVFDAEGGYHYRQFSEDFDGEYIYDEAAGTLKLIMSNKSNTYSGEEWGIEGRVLHIKNMYYFREMT